MPEPFTVSRRRAAVLLAGTAVAAASAAAATPARVDTSALEAAGSNHRDIAALLARVRTAKGQAERAEAFRRCKDALRGHDVTEAFTQYDRQVGSQALYRQADASVALMAIIVRELDAAPHMEPCWMRRFGDLETAFAAHVREHEG